MIGSTDSEDSNTRRSQKVLEHLRGSEGEQSGGAKARAKLEAGTNSMLE